MAIYDDVKITINLNELVEIRAKLISQYDDYSERVNKGEYLDGGDILCFHISLDMYSSKGIFLLIINSSVGLLLQ